MQKCLEENIINTIQEIGKDKSFLNRYQKQRNSSKNQQMKIHENMVYAQFKKLSGKHTDIPQNQHFSLIQTRE